MSKYQEFHRPAIDTERIKPRGQLLVVKKYTKPNRYGSLWLPEEWLEDHTGTLWEFVKASEKALAVLGTTNIKENDIIKTRLHWPATDSGLRDEKDDRGLHFMDADEVWQVWMLDNEEDSA